MMIASRVISGHYKPMIGTCPYDLYLGWFPRYLGSQRKSAAALNLAKIPSMPVELDW